MESLVQIKQMKDKSIVLIILQTKIKRLKIYSQLQEPF